MDTQATRSLSDRIAQNVFALVDLQLYLDTHPADTGALEQYIDISEQLRLLKSQYIREHAPLYNFGGAGNSKWLWNESPWPWEIKGRA